jgi:hypothetical protein
MSLVEYGMIGVLSLYFSFGPSPMELIGFPVWLPACLSDLTFSCMISRYNHLSIFSNGR